MTNHSTDRPATDTGHPKRNPQECIVVYHGQPDGSVRRRVRTIRSLTTEDDGSHRPTGPQGVVGDENAPLASDPEEYRQEVHVYVKEGETEGRLYGGHLQLIRITLSDGGSYERQDGSIVNPPDVICTMRPDDARRLIERLQDAIDQADCLSA